jgi:adenosylcobinamide kinase/adenosylcobinamide-phosphate guanylyltransferase
MAVYPEFRGNVLKSEIIFVVGGCRSGKSSFALDQAGQIKGSEKYFIATSVPMDPEMEKRVETHQQQRGRDWHTIEEPVLIYESIDQCSNNADVILVDCLTLWVSNLLMHSCDQDHILRNIDMLVKSLDQCPGRRSFSGAQCRQPSHRSGKSRGAGGAGPPWHYPG